MVCLCHCRWGAPLFLLWALLWETLQRGPTTPPPSTTTWPWCWPSSSTMAVLWCARSVQDQNTHEMHTFIPDRQENLYMIGVWVIGPQLSDFNEFLWPAWKKEISQAPAAEILLKSGNETFERSNHLYTCINYSTCIWEDAKLIIGLCVIEETIRIIQNMGRLAPPGSGSWEQSSIKKWWTMSDEHLLCEINVTFTGS